MILNVEEGLKIFGGIEDMYKSTVIGLINNDIPNEIDKLCISNSGGNMEYTKNSLIKLKGSVKFNKQYYES